MYIKQLDMSTSRLVDTSGIPFASLLFYMALRKHVACFFTISGLPDPIVDMKEIIKALDAPNNYIDYCCGRLIKTSFNSYLIDPTSYDADVQGTEPTLQMIVNEMRNSCLF
jgi:hypothetical protein